MLLIVLRRLGLSLAVLAVTAAAPTASAQKEAEVSQPFLLGVAKHDITGPPLDCGFMGYANPLQRGDGIHMRLWARAFVVSSPSQARQVAIVSADLGMIFQAVTQEVVIRLQRQLGPLYDERNVLLTATHTHSGPGGYSHYALYNHASGGFDDQNFEVVVDGIVAAIVQAHASLQPGRIRIAEGELPDASLNRSLPAYLQNPPDELARYHHEVDRTMTLLRFEDATGRAIGMLNWFAVHPTNIGNANTLISGDNKGYASRAFEQLAGGEGAPFVAAFAQAEAGDVSPNLWGTPDRRHDEERMITIATRQVEKALELHCGAMADLASDLDYRHTHVNFASLAVEGRWVPGGKARVLGRAAIGASMLAGAEDGPGLPFLREGLVYGVNWPALTLFPRDQAMHAEKPIVLVMGSAHPPLTPAVLPLQVITIGSLAIIAAPFEITTMAGRRLQQTVLQELAAQGIRQAVIAGLSNAYAGYVATREEYAVQHYEGASTHFGPFTASALQQEYHRLARALANGQPAAPGPDPPILQLRSRDRRPGPDPLPSDATFGALVADVPATAAAGDPIRASFRSGHPRHDLQTMASYLSVQHLVDGEWQTIATDDHPATRIRFRREGRSLVAEVEWQSSPATPPGAYRLLQHGHFKNPAGLHPYLGVSRTFGITSGAP